MFGLFGKKSSKLIGVELSPEKVVVSQIKRQGKTNRLTHLAEAPMPDGAMLEGRINEPAAVGEILKELIAQHKIPAGTGVVTGLPGRDAIVRLIRVKADLSEEELRRAVIEEEAPLYIPYTRDQADIDYQPLGLELSADNTERLEVLLVATPKELVDNYIEAIRLANLSVKCVELNSFSVIRTIKDQLAQFSSQEAVVLAIIGYESTEINVIVNGIPHFSRTVTLGTTHMQQMLGQALNMPPSRAKELLSSIKLPVISPTESLATGERVSTNPGVAAVTRVMADLADELRRSMDFYLNQPGSVPIARLILAGSGAGITYVDGYLGNRLGIATELADPFASVALPDNLEIALNQRPALGV
ncbi:MAG: type IV pilus assembly protein PilM, partial [Thermostichales cyanobacterium DRC_bins_46]